MPRAGEWVRDQVEWSTPTGHISLAVLPFGQGYTLTRTLWSWQFWYDGVPLTPGMWPLTESVATLAVSDFGVQPPDPLADRNYSWLWWQTLTWTPQTWSDVVNGETTWRTHWTAPPEPQSVLETRAQRRAATTQELWLTYEAADRDMMQVTGRCVVSAYVLMPPSS